MDGHDRQICVFDPFNRLGSCIGPGLEVLLVGILRDAVEVLQVQGVLVRRHQM